MAQQRELLCKLLDIYGMALSSRCRDVLEYYYADDLSLAEISENMGITRQGVHDAIRRGEAELPARKEEVHHAMEDVVVAHLVKLLEWASVVALPYDKRNLNLLLWRHRGCNHTVHIDITLAKTLAVVRNINHSTISILYRAQNFDYRV